MPEHMPPRTVLSRQTMNAIEAEALRAHLLHGQKSMLHPNRTEDSRFRILAEEVGEVARALNDGVPTEDKVRELIQVAAMAASWIEVAEGQWAGMGFAMPEEEERFIEEERIYAQTSMPTKAYKAGHEFLERCGLEPTEDAVAQLVEAFLPALAMVCQRDNDPMGRTWQEGGWRGQVLELMRKARRLEYRTWRHGRQDFDSAYDAINYAGFLARAWQMGLMPWGELGEPEDNDKAAIVHELSVAEGDAAEMRQQREQLKDELYEGRHRHG